VNPYIGTSLQSLLEELGEWDEVRARAQKKVVADQIRRAMEQAQVTKSELAKRMKTSRSQLDDILNPNDPGLTLISLSKVSYALGLEPKITFEKVLPMKKAIL
jgi:antitoxin HicB